jgi:hypothetical protein
MTSNRKAKAAARELAAETGRSYTHAKRAESAGTAPAAAPAAAAASPMLLPHVPSTFPGPGTCAYCGRWYPLGQENEGCPDRPADAEPVAIKRFPADAELLVDAHNGAETWTGEQWNTYASSCEDPETGGAFNVQLLDVIWRGTETTGQTRPELAAGTRQCPACHGDRSIETDDGSIECGLCESTGSVPVPGAAVAELHRQALALAELLEQADAQLLGIYGQGARRLAELGNIDQFYAGARQLAQDVDDLRATPNGHKTDALFRWRENPVEAAHALARRARMVALDRCEVDEHDRACSGSRSLSLAVWAVDGLSEAWPELCVQHLVDYAERWDPSYAELVIGGEYHAARAAFAELHSRRPGEHNARIAGPGEDRYGRRREPAPAPSPDAETCRYCGAAIEPGDEHEC